MDHGGSTPRLSLQELGTAIRPRPKIQRWRDALILALSVLLVVTMSQLLQTPSPALAAVPTKAAVPCPAERPDEMSALVTARLCGGKVEIASRLSERTRAWAQPSGSIYLESTMEPERIRDKSGTWVAVDMTLAARPDGLVAPRAHPNGLVLAGAAVAGDNDLATLTIGGEPVALGWRGALPKPVLSGTKATYADVKPGVDLVVEATRTSFNYALVVKNRQASAAVNEIAMPWKTGSLTPVTMPDGGLELRDRAGKKAASVPAPRMWDSTVEPRSGEHVRHSGLGLKVAAKAKGKDLVLSPPRSFLDDPATVYPVTIDPGPTDFNPNFDAFVESDLTTDQSGSTELRIGTFDGGATVARSFMSYWLGGFLHGATVQTAYLFLWNFHSWSCTPTLWQVYWSPYVNGSLRWSNQPYADVTYVNQSSQTLGYTGCGQNWVWTDAASGVQKLADDPASSTVNFRITAASETNNTYWKKFDSAQGAHQPILRITYTMKPTVSEQATVPATQCVTGAGRPYINTTTPGLAARITDAEGASVSAGFEWWNTGGSMIGSTATSAVPSGSVLSATVPSGAFTNGSTYSWRVRGGDGITLGDWSPWCEMTVDTTVPSAAPSVSSTAYPSSGWWGTAGTPGDFVLGASGVSDVASYRYGLDTNPPTTVVAAPSLGANATVSIAPSPSGPHTLYVQSLDRAGNASPVATYSFNVGVGAVMSPKTGAVSGARFVLTALAPSGATGATYQWRRGDADTWTTIPTSDVTVAAGGGAVTWPQASSGGGAFANLNWDVAKTLNDAEAGAEPLDGPLQVHALFTGPSTTSDPVKVTFDLNRGWATAATVGPGSVNLLTGNLGVSQVDASAFTMAVSRTYNTRQAGVVDPMFGPGWASSTLADANRGYVSLTVTGSLAQVALADKSTLGFALESGNASTAVYEPQVGSEDFQLSWTSSPDRFTMIDGSGNTVLFTRPAGGATGLYIPSSATPIASTESTTTSWELVPGSTTQARPVRVLAPAPSGVSCSPSLAAGCKALTFTYATTTTASGTSPAGWGDYTGRVIKAEFSAWDPDASPAAMATIEVAHYAYDSNGRLRASWDPRLNWLDTDETPHVTRLVQTIYDYDGDGILNTLTPPGQQAWQFAFTTVPGDSGKGRLATVTRSALSAGTAVSTVVYRVPVTGAGAPYDLSSGQTSRWGQSEAPTDAAAVFPPTQVPTVNQPAGTLPGSYDYATVTHMDANGRTVNTVAPGGNIDTTWYDVYGHTVRTLTAANRKRALDASNSDSSAAEAVLASTLSTTNTYSADGQELLSTVGPVHDVTLAAGGVVRGQTQVVNTYDQGAPSGGPFHLVTTAVESVRYIGAAGTPVDADARTSTTDYDWTGRQPIVQTEDPAGLALTTRTGYAADGKVISETTAAGGATTNTPSTRLSTYYTAAANGTYAACGGKPAWEGLVCRIQPGGQPASGPELPYTVITYGLYGQVRTTVESTSAGELRRTTTTYDGAGRTETVAVVASGLGTTVPTVKTVYDRQTGLAVRTQSLDASNNVTAEIVRGYDALARLVSYTDANANTATTTYDIASRVATSYDGKATRTFTYDGGSERRGLATQVVDTGAGTMTATYDAAGSVVSQTWPNSVAVTTTVDEVGATTSITYTRTGCGQPDCTVYKESAGATVHGQWRDRTSTLSAQTYGYDQAGRLTSVRDTVTGACTVRVYAFDGTSGKATNRTGLTTYAPDENGACQTTTVGTARTYTYDSADRLTTSATVYDNLGRTLTTAAADTNLPAGGNVTMTYYTNDMVRTITQGSRTATYTSDVAASRLRSWTDNASGTAVTRTNHFALDGDSPVWTDEGNSTWTRPVDAIAGLAAVQTGPAAGNLVWQVVSLHGDVVAGMPNSGLGLSYTSEQTEYGVARVTADIGSRRYGWLGSGQRAADTPDGEILMGVRLYSPATGRMRQVDPVYQGSANSYEYCRGEPVGCTDLSGKGTDDCGRWQGFLWWKILKPCGVVNNRSKYWIIVSDQPDARPGSLRWLAPGNKSNQSPVSMRDVDSFYVYGIGRPRVVYIRSGYRSAIRYCTASGWLRLRGSVDVYC